VDFVKIFGSSRSNECGCSYLETLGDLLSFSIRRIRNKHEAVAICKALRDHKCNKQTPNPEHITSCSDALGRVLMDVLNVTEEELRGRG
jgi:hypothetical protein